MKKPDRRGALTVEIAIIIPVFFAVMIAAYDATRVNMLRHTAQGAAYEGARRGIVPGSTIEDIEADCRLIAESSGARNFTIKVEPSEITDETNEVSVTVSIPLRKNTVIASPFFGNIALEGTTTFQRELTD